MMTYKDALREAMRNLAVEPRTRFIGYGLKNGRAAGSLANASETQIIETPVAENLMTGIAIGQSLGGNLPLVYFERFDFVLNAADAIVNHLSAAEHISRGVFKPAVILRVVVGNRAKPLFTGKTHTQDFSAAFAGMVDFPVVALTEPSEILAEYPSARERQHNGISTMLVEYKDLI